MYEDNKKLELTDEALDTVSGGSAGAFASVMDGNCYTTDPKKTSLRIGDCAHCKSYATCYNPLKPALAFVPKSYEF